MGYVRLTLAIIVLLAHSGLREISAFGVRIETIGSLASVQMFFVISGVFMAAVYSKKYAFNDRPVYSFYANRFIRLLPQYYAILIIGFVIFIFTYPHIEDNKRVFDFYTSYIKDGFSPDLLAATFLNIFIVGQDFASFSEDTHFKLLIRQGWSISTELFFYFIVPMLFFIKKRYFLPIVLFSLAVKLYFVNYCGFRCSYFNPFANMFYFLAGFFWVLFAKGFYENLQINNVIYGLLTASLIALFMLSGSASFELHSVSKNVIITLILVAASPALIGQPQSKLEKTCANISYGVYLSHFLFIYLAGYFSFDRYINALFVLFFSVVLSLILERFLQVHVDKYRQNIK